MKVKTLNIFFDTPLKKSEIPLFRGAVISSLDDQHILFHNHEEEGLRYGYPLIQYKRIHQKAAIICVGEGTEAIGEFFASRQTEMALGDRDISLVIESVTPCQTEVRCWDDEFQYSLRGWLPFNQENYAKYSALETIVEKVQLLEHILTGNILSFLKGIDYHIEDNLTVSITKLSDEHLTRYKNVKMMCFDVMFKSNLSLPDFIGLGKHPSVGYGTVTRFYHNQQ